MNDINGDTQDILALGGQLPAETGLPAKDTESHIRHLGIGWVITGSVILAAAVIAALTATVVNDTWIGTPGGTLFLPLAGMLIAAAGGGFLVGGLIEHTQRPTRTLIRRAMARADLNGQAANANREAIDRLSELVNQHIVLTGTIDRQQEETRTALETMGAALDEIARYLPENQGLHNWRGFNTAVRERLATGTDSSSQRNQGRLGLVKNDGPQG